MYLGYLFGAVALLLVLTFGFLFIAPGTSLFGVTSISSRQEYTKYSVDENPTLKKALHWRNIIIESNFIDVEVRVRNVEQDDEGSIVVWEEGISGLTFNSVKRTHIEWSQVIVQRFDDNGAFIASELYYKIKVIEPQGMVSRSSKNEVYINMYATDTGGEVSTPFNFILNTGSSNVRFASDDDCKLFENPLYVDKLEIQNASGTIYLPPKNHNSFYVEVGEVSVNSRSVKVNCESPVSRGVNINCAGTGSFTFRSIGGGIEGGDLNVKGGTNSVSVVSVGGDVNLQGARVNFTQKPGNVDGKIDGNVRFEADSGALSIARCTNLYMRTKNANAAVTGTISNLDYEATGSGGVNINQVNGGSTAHVVTINGGVTIRNVWVNTDVETRSGGIVVEFAAGAVGLGFAPTLTINAYDGSVSAKNICGTANITVAALGNAVVNAHFARVVDDCEINYIGSYNPTYNKGQITVSLPKAIDYFILWVDRTASTYNKTNPTMLRDFNSYEPIAYNVTLNNNTAYRVNWTSGGGDSTGNLHVSTSNRVTVTSV